MPTAPSAGARCPLFIAILLLVAGISQAKTVLVVAPHPDDEALCCSGVIYSALHHGETVYVVVVTNGDDDSVGTTSEGLKREGETVRGMRLLGLDEQHVIFLGYGDDLALKLYQSRDPNQVYTSRPGVTRTYGDRGLGGVDYHYQLYGVHGLYNRSTMMLDVTALLRNIHPDDIYTTGIVDGHSDHEATGLAVMEAIRTIQSSDPSFQPRLHETVIHAPNGDRWWPQPVLAPAMPFSPSGSMAQTPLDWTQIESIPVPAVMQDPNPGTNLKVKVIRSYESQIGQGFNGWVFSFLRQNEFFWVQEPSLNVALRATVTDSSEAPGGNNAGRKAIDGEIPSQFGAFIPTLTEPLTNLAWITNNQLAGAWIQLSWNTAVTVDEVKLSNRPDPGQNVLAGTLTFSDGSSIPVGALPTYGKPGPIVFPPKTITWVKFTITRAQGTATGLGEFQVLKPSTPRPIAVTFSPSQVVAGESSHGSVTLSAADPTADTIVRLTSDNNAVNIPATVTVPAGATKGTFTALAAPSAQPGQADITPTANGASQAGVLEIVPVPPLAAMSLDDDDVVGGAAVNCTIMLGAPTSTDAVVSLSTTNPDAQVPASVTIRAGTASTTFAIPTSRVTSYTTGGVIAVYSDAKLSASLTLRPSLIVVFMSGSAHWLERHRRRCATLLFLVGINIASAFWLSKRRYARPLALRAVSGAAHLDAAHGSVLFPSGSSEIRPARDSLAAVDKGSRRWKRAFKRADE